MPDRADGYVPGDAVDRVVRKVATHLSRFTAKSYADEATDAPSVHGSSPYGTLAEIPLAPRLEEIKSLLASGAISPEEAGLRRKRFFDARDAAAAEAEERDAAYARTHKRQAERRAEMAAASTRSAEMAAEAERERVAAAKAQLKVDEPAAQGAQGAQGAEGAERVATAEAEEAAAARREREEAERAEEERAAIAEADKVAQRAADERAEAERAAEAAAERASAAAAGTTAAEKEEAERKAAAEAEKAAAAETEGLDIGKATAAQPRTNDLTKRGLPPVVSYEDDDLAKLEDAQ